MFDYRFAYLLGNLLLLLPVWAFFFYRRKDLRREMIMVSIITGAIGPISELWYLQDYWKPETFTGTSIGLEDFLFGFFIGGIARVIYEEIFGKKYAKRKDRRHHWPLFVIPFFICFIFSLHTLFALGLNSIYASIIGFLVFAAIIIFYRKDLFWDSLVSGLLVGALAFISYLIYLMMFPGVIQKWWLLNNITSVLIVGVPLEELMWAFGWGMVAGPMYEFFRGLRLQNDNII